MATFEVLEAAIAGTKRMLEDALQWPQTRASAPKYYDRLKTFSRQFDSLIAGRASDVLWNAEDGTLVKADGASPRSGSPKSKSASPVGDNTSIQRLLESQKELKEYLQSKENEVEEALVAYHVEGALREAWRCLVSFETLCEQRHIYEAQLFITRCEEFADILRRNDGDDERVQRFSAALDTARTRFLQAKEEADKAKQEAERIETELAAKNTESEATSTSTKQTPVKQPVVTAVSSSGKKGKAKSTVAAVERDNDVVSLVELLTTASASQLNEVASSIQRLCESSPAHCKKLTLRKTNGIPTLVSVLVNALGRGEHDTPLVASVAGTLLLVAQNVTGAGASIGKKGGTKAILGLLCAKPLVATPGLLESLLSLLAVTSKEDPQFGLLARLHGAIPIVLGVLPDFTTSATADVPSVAVVDAVFRLVVAFAKSDNNLPALTKAGNITNLYACLARLCPPEQLEVQLAGTASSTGEGKTAGAKVMRSPNYKLLTRALPAMTTLVSANQNGMHEAIACGVIPFCLSHLPIQRENLPTLKHFLDLLKACLGSEVGKDVFRRSEGVAIVYEQLFNLSGQPVAGASGPESPFNAIFGRVDDGGPEKSAGGDDATSVASTKVSTKSKTGGKKVGKGKKKGKKAAAVTTSVIVTAMSVLLKRSQSSPELPLDSSIPDPATFDVEACIADRKTPVPEPASLPPSAAPSTTAAPGGNDEIPVGSAARVRATPSTGSIGSGDASPTSDLMQPASDDYADMRVFMSEIDLTASLSQPIELVHDAGARPPNTVRNCRPRPEHLQVANPVEERMYAKPDSLQFEVTREDLERLIKPDVLYNYPVYDINAPHPQAPTIDPRPANAKAPMLRFDSLFECGNLRRAVWVRDREYDLLLNADINSTRHLQWFYFRVSGMQKDVPYRFNLVNMEKNNSQFNYGMQPVFYSTTDARTRGVGWTRRGDRITYYRNQYTRTGPNGKPASYFTCTFTMTADYDDDVCYIAYHYPYTYSDMNVHLDNLSAGRFAGRMRRQVLCRTLGDNPCEVVTITDPNFAGDENSYPIGQRIYVFLTSRVHPGETNASWIMRGVLEYLMGPSPAAAQLCGQYVFKIVPMVNPDGVINGNHRCSLTGDDLNRQYKTPDKYKHPTIYYIKRLLETMVHKYDKPPLLACDFHGHSRKKDIFIFGCNNSTHNKEQILPRLLHESSPCFNLAECNFKVQKSKEATARVVYWRELNVQNSFTMESTYCGASQGAFENMQFSAKHFDIMGADFCDAILEYGASVTSDRVASIQDALEQLWISKRGTPTAGAGDNSDDDDADDAATASRHASADDLPAPEGIEWMTSSKQ